VVAIGPGKAGFWTSAPLTSPEVSSCT
jgi:hypothetical protein